MHNVLRKYLEQRARPDLPRLHTHLLDVYWQGSHLQRWAELPSDEAWLWQQLISIFAEQAVTTPSRRRSPTDDTLRVWDMVGGEERLCLSGHPWPPGGPTASEAGWYLNARTPGLALALVCILGMARQCKAGSVVHEAAGPARASTAEAGGTCAHH